MGKVVGVVQGTYYRSRSLVAGDGAAETATGAADAATDAATETVVDTPGDVLRDVLRDAPGDAATDAPGGRGGGAAGGRSDGRGGRGDRRIPPLSNGKNYNTKNESNNYNICNNEVNIRD